MKTKYLTFALLVFACLSFAQKERKILWGASIIPHQDLVWLGNQLTSPKLSLGIELSAHYLLGARWEISGSTAYMSTNSKLAVKQFGPMLGRDISPEVERAKMVINYQTLISGISASLFNKNRNYYLNTGFHAYMSWKSSLTTKQIFKETTLKSKEVWNKHLNLMPIFSVGIGHQFTVNTKHTLFIQPFYQTRLPIFDKKGNPYRVYNVFGVKAGIKI